MHVQRYGDAAAFLVVAGDWLAEREAEHNLILGIALSLRAGQTFSDVRPLFLTVDTDGRLAAAAIRPPPWNLVLSEIDDPAAVPAIVDDLATDHGPTDLPGVTAPVEHAAAFAAAWGSRTGQAARIDIRERIFALTEIQAPQPVEGTARPAGSAERDLLVAWLDAFHDEAFDTPPPVAAAELIDRWLEDEDRTLWLWETDGHAVSLCGAGMGTPNGFRIGPVYTPPEVRGRGYASNLVAAATRAGLDKGKRFAFLLTDLANPTSNHIYQEIGYRPVSDVDMWRFEEEA